MLPSYLHDELIHRIPFKIHPLLSLVEAQGFLLSANPIISIKNNEDICIRASSKNITGVHCDLVRNNWFRKRQKTETSQKELGASLAMLLRKKN